MSSHGRPPTSSPAPHRRRRVRPPLAGHAEGRVLALVTHPVLVGGGTPFFTALDKWVNLNLVETRTFPGGVLLSRYETRR